VLHQKVGSREAMKITEQALRDVGIADPRRRLREYPHEMSGGMRQRIMIAMALSCKPKLLIADEPTTALDVTIQAQILELLRKIQKQTGMAIMLITHDLGVVAENADVVNVMYASRVVESANVIDLFDKPQHPYTQGLFRSVPQLGAHDVRLATIPGTVPNPANFPKGCKFHTRCLRTRELAAQAPADQAIQIPNGRETVSVMRRCVEESTVGVTSGEPGLREVHPQHWAACHYADGFDKAPLTEPVLAYKRPEIPLAQEVKA
jgi:oligopeptide/dipeptide ABC transporter ATP-binding protein